MELKPGKEINRAIAKAFKIDPDYAVQYSELVELAWPLLEHFQQLDIPISITSSCGFWMVKICPDRTFTGKGQTIPMAICIAVLKVKGVLKDDA